MGTNCALLVAGMFFFSFLVINKPILLRPLTECLDIYFKRMIPELQLNKANTLDTIRITCPCDLYPLTHFYIVKLGFTGVYIFSYF